MTCLWASSVLVWIWVFLGGKVIILVPNPNFFSIQCIMYIFTPNQKLRKRKKEERMEGGEEGGNKEGKFPVTIKEIFFIVCTTVFLHFSIPR